MAMDLGPSTYEEYLARNPEQRVALAQEGLILGTAEALWTALRARKITLLDLARRADYKPARVSEVFSGDHDMGLRELATLVHALGYEVEIKLRLLELGGSDG